ncbi:Regulation of nuclear pre-mRNA domain containing protein 1B [Clonorchis sinensis]|uniref:Regulation of nuclear pre-mRNA domain containing protein 1B n=1 Tax=Clonorchis sinensis TaxID=79923 RepID=A0A8T1MFP2_CLOSI|nr:Regulation of nuclear pre-mRNA domain containing protein 1B [Clonorchis sinensis]
MSYSEEEAVRRLQQLDNSQQSVEATSKWFLSSKDMAKELVKLWFKEFRKAPPKKKIAFLHLANDVIQSGITTAPQFGKLFEPVLPTAFKETAKVQRHSIRAAVAHLLIVWASRHIYSKSFLRQLRFICQRAVAEADTPGANEEVKRNIIAASPFAFSFTTVLAAFGDAVPAPTKISTPGSHSKRHKGPKSTMSFAPQSLSIVGFSPTGLSADSTRTSISAFREELARELQTEAITPPQTSELLEMLEKLQQPTASGDAATRRAIAQFPPEVSDANKAVEIITNASESERHELISRIANCATQLNKYNELLEEESSQRQKLSLSLRAYHAQLKSRIKDYEAELRELKEKCAHGLALKQELSKHMSSLPDLNLLPDMTAGLDPLPTVGDLFG